MTTGWCPTRKHRHPSRGKAEAQLRSVIKVRPEYAAQGRVYPCGQCAGWHVGRQRVRAHQSKY
jgi:hypothetical protein